MATVTTPNTSLAFLPRSTSKKFPFKLHELLSFAERNGLEDVVCWLPGGKGFMIQDHQQFCDKVLKVTFHHCNYKSFEKQLNNWNFRRDVHESGGKAYSHPNFLRGRKSLCQHMTSKSTRTKKTVVTTTKTNTYDSTNGTVTGVINAVPGTDHRVSALTAAFAKAVARASTSPVVSAAPVQHTTTTTTTTTTPTTTYVPPTNRTAPGVTNNTNLLDLRSRLVTSATSSPTMASALMNALQKRMAAKAAVMTTTASATPVSTSTTTPHESSTLSPTSSEDLAVALAKATVRRFAVLERLQLQQQFQRQQQALLLEQQKVEAHHQKQYQKNMQILLAAHHQRRQQQQQQQQQEEASKSSSSSASSPSMGGSSVPSTAILEKILAERKEQEERAVALLALRLPR